MASIHIDLYTKCGDLSTYDTSYFGLRWERWKDRPVESLVEVIHRQCHYKTTAVRELYIDRTELLEMYSSFPLSRLEGFRPGAVVKALLCDMSVCTCGENGPIKQTPPSVCDQIIMEGGLNSDSNSVILYNPKRQKVRAKMNPKKKVVSAPMATVENVTPNSEGAVDSVISPAPITGIDLPTYNK
eukprot:Ihof_evm1s438 gene=Ihof_evmTU1s438